MDKSQAILTDKTFQVLRVLKNALTFLSPAHL